MANLEHDWMDSTQPAHSTQGAPAPLARTRGFAMRAMSFLGEVITGRVKPAPRHARGRESVRPSSTAAEADGQSTLSPHRATPPALTPDQRKAQRAEQSQRQTLYLALKQLLDRESGRRQLVKPLWAVEQNIKGLGVKGLDGMAAHMTRTALLQLDALADYPENGALLQLRDILVAVNAKHGPEVDTQTAAPPPSTVAPARRTTIGIGEAVVPSASVEAIEIQDDDFGFFATGTQLNETGPDVMEAHGLEPFTPTPAPNFEMNLDMDLPALRQK